MMRGWLLFAAAQAHHCKRGRLLLCVRLRGRAWVVSPKQARAPKTRSMAKAWVESVQANYTEPVGFIDLLAHACTSKKRSYHVQLLAQIVIHLARQLDDAISSMVDGRKWRRALSPCGVGIGLYRLAWVLPRRWGR